MPESQFAVLQDMEMYFETSGEGPPLLLLHGYTQSGSHWTPFLNELGKHHRLIVPDLRGHGRSTNPTGRFTHRQAADDIFALVDYLQIDRFKAVGFSSGSMILLHMATRLPSRLDAMVLIAIAPYLDDQARSFIRRLSSTDSLQGQWLAKLREQHVGGDAQIHNLMEAFKAFGESYDDLSFTKPHLGTITAPTLIINGDRDAEFAVSHPVEIFEAIPKSFLWVVPNAGHWPLPGKNRLFTESILEFLRGDWEVDEDY